MMQFLNEIEQQLFFLLVALLLAFGLYQTIGGVLGTGTPIVSVVSNSMSPTFERGDMIVVQGTSIEDIEEGDVIVFESKYDIINQNRPPLIHRVIEKKNGMLATKGDANEKQITYCLGDRGFSIRSTCPPGTTLIQAEQNITAEQIHGKLLFTLPYIAHLKLIPTCLFYKLQLPNTHPAVQYSC